MMMDKRNCKGCYDDIYNRKDSDCWSLDSAELTKLVRVPVDQRPPWTQKPIECPSCYSLPGFVHVLPENPSCTRAG